MTTGLLVQFGATSPWLQVGPGWLDRLDPDGIHSIAVCEGIVNPGPDPVPTVRLLLVQLRLDLADTDSVEVVHAVIPATVLATLPTARDMFKRVRELTGLTVAPTTAALQELIDTNLRDLLPATDDPETL